MNKILDKFLKEKPLYYDKIDYSRMPRVYERIKQEFKDIPTVHLIGTNGKGTTGRFLASALYNLGFNVGHYTSPHILEFNERIWINNENISYQKLDVHHLKLLSLLTDNEVKSLSYFEYTTLLTMFIFQNLDYIILEAGLGGEFDATAVFPKILTLVTPIDMDHESFLGNTIEKITTTKLNAIQNSAILAKQVNEKVYTTAKAISIKNSVKIFNVNDFLEEEDYHNINIIKEKLQLAFYLTENLKVSISALNFLNIQYNSKAFENSILFGRLTPLNKNILIDVGHNILAAHSIFNSLKDKKYILIYNSYKDKNYTEILTILKPIIKHIELISIDDERIEKENILIQTIQKLEIKSNNFSKIDKDEKYLVFGSFKVVEQFLKTYYE